MKLEHINVSVEDPIEFAGLLGRLFGWHIRWQGPALNDGLTVHVGDDDSYLALYRQKGALIEGDSSYRTRGGLNHIGVVVDDLAAAEARVQAEGFTPHNHADYEPGQRFYFDGPDGIEFEVVHYG